MKHTRGLTSLLVLVVVVCAVAEATEVRPDTELRFPVLVEARFKKNFRRQCPNNAVCVLIDNCPKLQQLLKKPSLKSIRRLQSSTCRIVDRQPYVCCHKDDALRAATPTSTSTPQSAAAEPSRPKEDVLTDVDPTAPARTAAVTQPAVEETSAGAATTDPSTAPVSPAQQTPTPAGPSDAVSPDAPPSGAAPPGAALSGADEAPVPEQASGPINVSATTPAAEPSAQNTTEEEGSVDTRFLASDGKDEEEIIEEDYYLDDEHDQPKCGFGNIGTRIFGGRQAGTNAWPWIAVLGYGFVPEEVYWACGATLIGPNHVLTAAHCVTEETPDGLGVVSDLLKVRLGEHDLFNDNDGAVDATPLNIIVHENYTGRPTYSHDIAIIQLETNVSYTETISPVCLPGVLRPPVEIPGTGEAAGSPGVSPDVYIVSGWGSDGVHHGTDILMEVEVTEVNGTSCREHFGRFNIPVVDRIQLCAGGRGVDSCSGDSGGPLIQDIHGQYELVGVVSLGGVVCGGTIPGLYTRVQAYTDWISRVVENGAQ